MPGIPVKLLLDESVPRGRNEMQASDERGTDTLYDDNGTLKMRGGRYRITAICSRQNSITLLIEIGEN